MLALSERPFRFQDIIGERQEDIVREFKHDMKTGNLPDYIILSGPTGSGKTSLAMILSAALNCKNPVAQDDGSVEPCGECAACLDVRYDRRERDVHYYDGSEMRKEDVLSLKTQVRTRPMQDNAKVFIIDEAQEISHQARSVFMDLMGREQTNNNVHFILCTMNPLSDLPKAIRDRARSKEFKKVKAEEIAVYLFDVLERHDYITEDDNGVHSDILPDEFIDEGLARISQIADGSVRAALQYLESCLSGEYFTVEKIEEVFGVISSTHFQSLFKKVLNKNPDVLAELLDYDIVYFFFELWKAARITFVALSSPAYRDTLKEMQRNTVDYVEKHHMEERIKSLVSFCQSVYTDVQTNVRASYVWSALSLHLSLQKGTPVLHEKPKRRKLVNGG